MHKMKNVVKLCGMCYKRKAYYKVYGSEENTIKVCFTTHIPNTLHN